MVSAARRLVWLALAFLLPVAFLPGGLNAFGPAKRDVFLLLAVAQAGLFAAGGGWRARARSLARSPLSWPAACAALACTAPAIVRSAGPSEVLGGLETGAAALLGLALLADGSRALGAKILAVHAAGVGCACAYAGVQRAGLDPLAWQRGFAGGAPGSTYGNPLFLADGAAAALLWAVAGWAAARGSRRLGWGLAGVLFAATLGATQARGAWLGAAAGLAWMAAAGPRRARTLVAAVGTAGLLLAAVGVGGARLGGVLDPAREEFRGRLLMWEASARMAAEHPVVGWGPGGVRAGYTLAQAGLLAEPRYRSVPYHSTSHSHQDYLQWLAEGGVLSLGTILWLGATALRAAWDAAARRRTALAASASLVAWAADGWVNGPFHLLPSSVLAWPFAASAAGLPRPAGGRGHRVAAAAAAAVGLLLARPYARDLVSEGYAQRAMFALQTNDPATAAHAAQRSLALAIEDRRQHYLLGESYRALRRTDEAADEFRADVEANPGFASAWRDLALAERDRGHEAVAREALRRAVALNPRDAEGLAWLARWGRDAGRVDRPEAR